MKSTTRRRLYAAGVIVVLLVTLWRVGPWSGHKAAPAKGAGDVAVEIATVTRRDVPVYLEGLGTVQAFYTVTVTPRVDGQVDRVAFVEGQEVRKGALLAQIDPRPYRAALDQAVAVRAKDQAQLANARLDLDRYALLAPEDLASKQTVDTQRALVAQLVAQVASDTASIDSARTQLDYTSITSPIDGRTGIRQVDPGNNVRATDTTGIVVLTQLHPISVIFSLPEDAYGDLSGAMRRGPVEATALSRNHRDELDHGTVALIDNQIDQTTGTIRVKATFPNKLNTLWPGEFVNVRVLTEVRRQALTIPASALQRGPEGLYTYVVQPDSSVVATPLTMREQSADVVAIDTGLSEGQRVVASNQYKVQPKTHVRAANGAAAAPPAAPGHAP